MNSECIHSEYARYEQDKRVENCPSMELFEARSGMDGKSVEGPRSSLLHTFRFFLGTHFRFNAKF